MNIQPVRFITPMKTINYQKTTNNSVTNSIEQRNYPKNISFGYCEIHVEKSNSISVFFNNKLIDMKVNNLTKKKEDLLDISNSATKEATNFLLMFANKQKDEAEFIPLWTIINNEKTSTLMDNSDIFKDTIQNLIAANNVQKVKIKNPKLSTEQLEKAQGSLQLHTIVILLNQIEKNRENQVFLSENGQQNADELVSIINKKIDDIYGEGVYEKIKKLSEVGSNPDVRTKKESLDFLMFIENNAKKIDFGKEFEDKLIKLVENEKKLELAKKEHPHEHSHTNIGEEKIEITQEELLISHHSHDHIHEDGSHHHDHNHHEHSH